MVICISFLLWLLKKIKFVRQEDWILAVVAMTIGAVVFPQIAEIGKFSYNVKFPQMVLHMVGMAIGGFTVTFHDTIWRFMSKRFGIPSGSTEFITKTKTDNLDGGTTTREVKTTTTPANPDNV